MVKCSSQLEIFIYVFSIAKLHSSVYDLHRYLPCINAIHNKLYHSKKHLVTDFQFILQFIYLRECKHVSGSSLAVFIDTCSPHIYRTQELTDESIYPPSQLSICGLLIMCLPVPVLYGSYTVCVYIYIYIYICQSTWTNNQFVDLQ